MTVERANGPEMLKAKLAERAWSQGDLERELGSADGLVSKWCRGIRTPGLEYALALERLLGIPAISWTTVESRTGTDG